MDFRRFVKLFIPKGLFKKVEPFGHLCEAVLFNVINGFPARKLKIIGVTGTNGKTTTSFMIYKMLQNAGYKVGVMTTVAYGAGGELKEQLHHITSQPVPELMRRLKWMNKQGVEWLVLETTSHAMAQNRNWGIPFSVAVLTNITHEHLAYHGTFERYLAAKRKLFELANKNRRGLRTGVINADDPNAGVFAGAIKNVVLYGQKKGELRASNVELSPSGIKYEVKVGQDHYHISSPLAGSFNVENSLAALGVGRTLGLSKEQIEQGIASLTEVEGRMVRIDEGQDFDVIVDYAHTPDSFEKLFRDLKPVVKGRLIVLFGSLGGGDKGKRPKQGRLAGEYADLVVICQEDDRQEDPQVIMNDITAGAEAAGKKRDNDLFLIHDRPKAMQFAVNQARKGDTVLFLGKGHEKTMEDATGEHPWDEVATARKVVRNRQRP